MDSALIFGLGLIGQLSLEALSELSVEANGVDKIEKDHLSKTFNNLNKTYICDATNESEVKKLMDEIFKEKHPPKILINALGIDVKVGTNVNEFKSIEFQNSNDFNKALESGLTSYFITSKHFVLQHLKNKSSGKIINIASDLSVIAPDHKLYNESEKIINFKPAHYGVVKHGIVGLTKYFAATFAPNITANSLSPSGILQENMSVEFIEKLSSRTPMNRVLNKNELIEPIKFLCNVNNSFLTGQNLIVDGGRSII